MPLVSFALAFTPLFALTLTFTLASGWTLGLTYSLHVILMLFSDSSGYDMRANLKPACVKVTLALTLTLTLTLTPTLNLNRTPTKPKPKPNPNPNTANCRACRMKSS